MMAWLDIVIVAIVLISALLGLAHGLVKEAVALITWVAAIWLAVVYTGALSNWLPSMPERATFSLGGTDFEIRNVRLGLAFILIVIGTLIAGAAVNTMLAKVTRARVLNGADRMLGFGFGVMRGAVIVIILTLAAGLTVAPHAGWWQASRLVPSFERGAVSVLNWLPPTIAAHFSFNRAVSR
jgi:membrane protein required for colicin V production